MPAPAKPVRARMNWKASAVKLESFFGDVLRILDMKSATYSEVVAAVKVQVEGRKTADQEIVRLGINVRRLEVEIDTARRNGRAVQQRNREIADHLRDAHELICDLAAAMPASARCAATEARNSIETTQYFANVDNLPRDAEQRVAVIALTNARTFQQRMAKLAAADPSDDIPF